MPEPQSTLRNLVLAGATLDRDAARRGERGAVRAMLEDEATTVLEVRGDRVPVTRHEVGATVQMRSATAEDAQWYEDWGVVLYLGRTSSRQPAVAVLRPADEAPEENWRNLREIGLDLPQEEVALVTTAVALAHWHAAHPHCSRCGGTTVPREAGWVRECVVDGSHHFPRTDPAVIMAVVDDKDRLLLARGHRWSGPHRSVLAGFVEPGESFEAAVARETLEESGVVVGEVTYTGNQPWPFPASLMIGFLAKAQTTDLTPQPGEIEEIAWYSREDVRQGLDDGSLRLPGRLSIARGLIERWYGGEIPDPGFASVKGSA